MGVFLCPREKSETAKMQKTFVNLVVEIELIGCGEDEETAAIDARAQIDRAIQTLPTWGARHTNGRVVCTRTEDVA